MIKLFSLISPALLVESEEKELPEEFEVFESGYEYLKARIDELNHKANKYKVPPLEIIIIKEEMVKVLHPNIKNQASSIQNFNPEEILNDPNSWIFVKKYTLSIKGDPPKIEGYKFIARLEHTPEGNFIYKSPLASDVNLPSDFKTVSQRCDVCHTNRDRNDTFVVQMEKDDPERFPDKKAGDMLIVGRNCLSRFLPGISIAGLIAYTNIIDNIQKEVKNSKDREEFDPEYKSSGKRLKYYESSDDLLFWIAAAYIHAGRYISKSQSEKNLAMCIAGNLVFTTLSRPPYPLLSLLQGVENPEKEYPIYFRIKRDKDFIKKIEDLTDEFKKWLSTKDWEKLAQEKPEKADFIHNLALVSKQEYLQSQQFGFFSALFQLFLRDKKQAEDKAEAEKQAALRPPSPVDFSNPSLVGKRLRDIAKESEIKSLLEKGMDEASIKKAIRGRTWGWEIIVKKISTYEKTYTFGYGDAGIGFRTIFEDPFGNEFIWFSSNGPGMENGEKYLIDGTVVAFEPPTQYHPNKPQIKINRVKIIKDL